MESYKERAVGQEWAKSVTVYCKTLRIDRIVKRKASGSGRTIYGLLTFGVNVGELSCWFGDCGQSESHFGMPRRCISQVI